MKILITGATGTVGKELGKALAKKGHDLVVISRNAEKARAHLPFDCEVIEGDLFQSTLKLPVCEAVFHLMGESIDGRWTEEKKQMIKQSRVQSTVHLMKSLNQKKPELFVSASAQGIYGDRGDEEITESSALGSDFLAEVCQEWEGASEGLAESGTRRVVFRLGIVLHAHTGALSKMLMPIKMGVGGPLGGGEQFISWIHIQDVVRAMLASLENKSLSGVYNLVSPQPVRNKEFTQILGQIVQRPTVLPTPSTVLKLVLGEMSQLVLSSARVFPKRLQESGFEFQFLDLSSALNDLLKDQEGVNEVFYAEQFLPYSIDRVFEFFSRAENLEEITPAILNFKIESVSHASVQKGTLIDYKLKIRGLPAKWRTLIAEWNPPYEFVDMQLKGPYSLWHHTHQFQEVKGGTLMTDRVRYRLPFGYLGWLMGIALVKNDVSEIFAYRREKVKKLI